MDTVLEDAVSEKRTELAFYPPEESGKYALFLGDSEQSGKLRIYDDLARAKIAWQVRKYYQHPVAKILENVEGNWYTLYDIPRDAANDRSLIPWYKPYDSGYNYYSSRSGKSYRAKPMTREEYANWRVAVIKEQYDLY